MEFNEIIQARLVQLETQLAGLLAEQKSLIEHTMPEI